MRNLLSSLLLVTLPLLSYGQDKVKTYIAKYQHIAVAEMNRSGIPASITLAQGMFESAYGLSPSAISYNNHFGIKCKKEWTGAYFYKHDDDRDKNGKLIPSCFRAYDSVDASFEDHTNFLVERARYAELFNFDQTDYFNWAHGLERCGYATNKMYGERLVEIIERYALHQFDIPADAAPVLVEASMTIPVEAVAEEIPVATDAFAQAVSDSRVSDLSDEMVGDDQALVTNKASDSAETADAETDNAESTTPKILDTFKAFSNVIVAEMPVAIDTIPMTTLTMNQKIIKPSKSRINQAIMLPESYQKRIYNADVAESELR